MLVQAELEVERKMLEVLSLGQRYLCSHTFFDTSNLPWTQERNRIFQRHRQDSDFIVTATTSKKCTKQVIFIKNLHELVYVYSQVFFCKT